MYCRHKFTVSEREVPSSPLLPRLEAQADVQDEDNERIPAQIELSTTLHLLCLDNNQRQRAIPCKMSIEHILNLFMFENDKPGHVASVLT